jgi:ketosteroid isomerase-like protein
VTLSHAEIFRKYLYAGAISRDPDAVAALFAEDGVYEAPLMPGGLRLAGRAAVRDGIGAVQQDPRSAETVDFARSGSVLHDTADPDVFVVEIDTVFASGRSMSLVWIFRVRDGLIVRLRDYFRPA